MEEEGRRREREAGRERQEGRKEGRRETTVRRVFGGRRRKEKTKGEGETRGGGKGRNYIKGGVRWQKKEGEENGSRGKRRDGWELY